MLFDSSVWIHYLKGVSSPYTDLLDKKLSEFGEPDVYICPPVFQEVLQGIRQNKNYEEIKDLMITCRFLQLDPYHVAEQAAFMYRQIRTKGITIRSPNDCLIAYYAIHYKIPLVHDDRDFNNLALHTSLKVYSAK